MSGRKPSPAKLATIPTAETNRGAGAAAEPAVTSADIATVAAPDPRVGDASAVARKLAADVEAALSRGEADLLSEDAIQALMAAACRSYAARIEAGSNFLPLTPRSPVTSTDVMVTASGLLKSANLAVFELGMWQSWTGR
jgi:hypothetical protein